MASAFARKSGPSSALSRGPSPAKSSPASASSRRSSRGPSGSLRSVSVKAVPGAAIASRRTTSPIACASARSERRNLSRAGVALKSPSSSTTVPRRERRRPHRQRRAAAHGDARGLGRPRRARRHRQPPHRPERGQRLAAEPEAQDVGEVGPVDLRCRVPVERQPQLPGRDPVPVVRHPDQPLAAVGIGDVDPPRPGVERVLDELLHRRSRPLHHLARRDAVRRRRVELPDRAAYLGGLDVHTPRSSTAGVDTPPVIG